MISEVMQYAIVMGVRDNSQIADGMVRGKCSKYLGKYGSCYEGVYEVYEDMGDANEALHGIASDTCSEQNDFVRYATGGTWGELVASCDNTTCIDEEGNEYEVEIESHCECGTYADGRRWFSDGDVTKYRVVEVIDGEVCE